MLQRVGQGIGSGSVSEWGPASSGVVRSAPVHTTAGIPALEILQYCHPKSCAVFLCSACANTFLRGGVGGGGWGGGGGGVKIFCLIGYKQWGRTVLVTRPAVQW